MPRDVANLLGVIAPVFSFSLGSLGLPLACVSLSSFYQRLLVIMLAPYLLCLVILLGCVLYCLQLLRVVKGSVRPSMRSPYHAGALAALPAMLVISFLAFPAVSSLAFRGLQCEEFEDTRGVQSRLKADYEVDCEDEEHYGPVKRLSWLAIVLYPIGVPVFYYLLLRMAKTAIVKDRPTALSRALGWLHRDFEPECYHWEIVEVLREEARTGFATCRTYIAPLVTLLGDKKAHPGRLCHQSCARLYVPAAVRVHGDTRPYALYVHLPAVPCARQRSECSYNPWISKAIAHRPAGQAIADIFIPTLSRGRLLHSRVQL